LKISKFYIVAILFLSPLNQLIGQEGSLYYLKAINKFNSKFTQNIVTDLILDKDKTLWIATPTSLFQYNGYEIKQIKSLPQDKIKEMLEEYDDNIIIKEYPSKGASLTTIKSHIQKTMDLGFTPDLILIDYVDLLKPPSRRKEKKEEIDDLHYGTKGLAKELNLPIWSVSQVNRAGAKDEIVEGDKSAGSYEKQAIVDFGMSQSRLKKDKTEGTGRWHIQKNRYGPDGMTYNVNIDTSCGHIEVLGEYDDTEDYKNQPQAPASKFGGITSNEKNAMSDLFKNFSLSNGSE
jgi:hypothetical protein